MTIMLEVAQATPEVLMLAVAADSGNEHTILCNILCNIPYPIPH